MNLKQSFYKVLTLIHPTDVANLQANLQEESAEKKIR